MVFTIQSVRVFGYGNENRFEHFGGYLTSFIYIFLKRLHNTSTPSSCKAISISKTTSSGPAAFPGLQCCNAHRTSFNIEGPDSYEAALSSSSSLSSWNKEAMYSSQRFAISSGSHKTGAYAETFHGGVFIQRHRVAICIWCALFVTSQNDVIVLFPNQRFGEVC